jgi:hypothetical protein
MQFFQPVHLVAIFATCSLIIYKMIFEKKHYSEPKQGELRVFNIDKGIIDKVETYRLANNEPSAF